ncbi:nitrous oxide reductase family maturation protein NosD [Ralstonia pickettii]|uniref:nitrous oxide reductase family maturation protein NosD n=1 Tax=Ralstonia pickettii TaxID=329 RepID=UPI0015F906B0|nr:nitrous oxide reductase family maturation protein NosD [Ralstonia pickettii]MBB0023759.1 nitrous oxide reductase family maturation protein NosD [Ralstonia pickettii]MBB0033808.1 nitrous oxide reductase family maturation protein NosD [Ralstonia pickettii]MBB0096480.1 nitrous oxide reductase family maturation protein NosD [Ralstonia pickettii]MBB0106276.1 nitrous oxide reductase family maturation protein NosD [Ralstonia pickettii]MBB0126630.1 nitrous oxide reductase family maturation protein 
MRWLPVLLVVCIWLAAVQGAHASAATTVRVAAGQSLQAAIDAAHPGDVLEIERGMYIGNLIVNKPLTLRGLDRPTLSGGQRGDTIRIGAPDVVIEGLIVRDSGDSLKEQNAGINILPGAHRAVVRQCELTYNLFGLWIEKANDVRIEANTITGKRDYNSAQRGNGVELYNTQGARIIGNNISFVRDALYVDVSHHAVFKGNRLHHSRYGTHYMNSYYNLWEDNDSYANRGGLALMEVRDQIVRNNRTWGNADHGIMLRTLQDSVVENNVVADNDRGFFIYDVEYTQLRGNLIVGNQVGVHLSAGSTRNVVQGNDFIGNREQVRYVGARDEAWGARTAAERPQGNFWSDYLGWDRDGDGIGDVPYEANDVVDRLIWRHPGVQLLLASPAVQALRFVSRQFPILRVPSVVDAYPRMQPANPHWSTWRDRSPSR